MKKKQSLRSFDKKYLSHLNQYFRAANYLTAGQIYLKKNPLLKEKLRPEHLKKRLLGHWGTSPGLNLIYLHLNRLIQDTKAKILYITGPGHGGPALRANVFLEGVMSHTYPDISQSEKGLEKLMKEFSWPGGVPSHVSPPTPGSIHEGGELGYSLSHAFGAAFDNPDLIVACVVGDGEAETGPLATSWHSNKFLNPKNDGAVLPILHLNGYKISGPTIFGRMPKEELKKFFEGCGYHPFFVEGKEVDSVHQKFWQTLNVVYDEIREIQKKAKNSKQNHMPKWPMIILRTPKGWTGPKVVDHKKVEGTFRAHQVPISDVIENKEHFDLLEKWLSSYKVNELFSKEGKPKKEILEFVPSEALQMGNSPYANGGKLLKNLEFPDFKKYALPIKKPGETIGEATRVLGKFLRDIFVLNEKNHNFRIFCPDETNSNRLTNVFDVTDRTFEEKINPDDDHLSQKGRVMEVLSEHQCQGWLEGYLLTGRHGIFPCYEAFALIADSMLNQHAKWLKACQEISWRKPIASLNYLLTSHAWRQDHNGYSHQGPGFIESVLEKKSSVARIYLPADANTLLVTANHCLKSKGYVNLIISGKQPMPQWLNMKEAIEHSKRGISIWDWASSKNKKPEVILASSGDTPTLEILATVDLLNTHFPDLAIQMVNVLDLFTLMTHDRHPHGLKDESFNRLFPNDIPVIFAFHGHPRVIHELIYKREKNKDFHVHGYIEEGTTTTPFDMVVCNKMSRFHLAQNAIQRVSRLRGKTRGFDEHCSKKLIEHKKYIYEHGEDLPEIVNWKWPS